MNAFFALIIWIGILISIGLIIAFIHYFSFIFIPIFIFIVVLIIAYYIYNWFMGKVKITIESPVCRLGEVINGRLIVTKRKKFEIKYISLDVTVEDELINPMRKYRTKQIVEFITVNVLELKDEQINFVNNKFEINFQARLPTVEEAWASYKNQRSKYDKYIPEKGISRTIIKGLEKLDGIIVNPRIWKLKAMASNNNIGFLTGDKKVPITFDKIN